jgi:hypothetical protein
LRAGILKVGDIVLRDSPSDTPTRKQLMTAIAVYMQSNGWEVADCVFFKGKHQHWQCATKYLTRVGRGRKI